MQRQRGDLQGGLVERTDDIGELCLAPGQLDLVAEVWPRYVRYKEAYFKDGWSVAAAPPAPFPEPGFADGHPFP